MKKPFQKRGQKVLRRNVIFRVCLSVGLAFLSFIIGLILGLCLLTGCMQTTNNNYRYQTNYGEECLYAPNTDSYKNLLFCYQVGLSEEHAQNKLTNATVSK